MLVVIHWILRNRKSPSVFRTRLNILTDFNNIVFFCSLNHQFFPSLWRPFQVHSQQLVSLSPSCSTDFSSLVKYPNICLFFTFHKRRQFLKAKKKIVIIRYNLHTSPPLNTISTPTPRYKLVEVRNVSTEVSNLKRATCKKRRGESYHFRETEIFNFLFFCKYLTTVYLQKQKSCSKKGKVYYTKFLEYFQQPERKEGKRT